MESRLEIQDYGSGRKKVTIVMTLSEEEKSELERKNSQRHIDSPNPIPCHFFQNEDPEIKIARGMPLWNNTPYKSYFLQTARRALLNRGIPGKTLLRIPFPGEVELGYINPNEETKLVKWWTETKKSAIDQMREKIYSVGKVKSEFKPSEKRTVDQSTVNLNPLNPDEKGGMRKRCLDIY
jgi:hypothetical protein